MIQPSLQIGGGDWAVKETKLLGTNPVLNKKIPVEIDVTNATIGTRVNKQGIIENGPRNLLTFSEDFTNAVWSKSSSSIFITNLVSPNKQSNSIKFTEDSTNNVHQIRTTFNSITGSTYTASIFVKGEQRHFVIRLRSHINTGNEAFAVFNTITKTVGSTGGTVWVPIASVTNFDNGWYRYSLTTTVAESATLAFDLILSNSSTIVQNYIGDGISGLNIWGAQVEQGSVATEYYPTITRTNLARIDYSSGEGVLLIEAQSTNLIQNSTTFENWLSLGTTVQVNNAIAPNGLIEADLISTSNPSSSYHYKVYNSTEKRLTDARSIWAKTVSGTGTISLLAHHSNLNSRFTITNEWQKFKLKGYNSIGAESTYAVDFRFGNLTEILIWQAQAEQELNTSDIFTTNSAVTRNADVISKTGINNLIGQTEGTMFLDFKYINSSSFERITLSNSINGARLSIGINDIKGLQFVAFNNGGSVLLNENYTINSQNKCAILYTSTLIKVFVNGVLRRTVAVSFTTNFNSLSNAYDNSFNFFQPINSIQLYKTALTDAECINLTTI